MKIRKNILTKIIAGSLTLGISLSTVVACSGINIDSFPTQSNIKANSLPSLSKNFKITKIDSNVEVVFEEENNVFEGWEYEIFEEDTDSIATLVLDGYRYRLGFRLKSDFEVDNDLDYSSYEAREIDGTTYYLTKILSDVVQPLNQLPVVDSNFQVAFLDGSPLLEFTTPLPDNWNFKIIHPISKEVITNPVIGQLYQVAIAPNFSYSTVITSNYFLYEIIKIGGLTYFIPPVFSSEYSNTIFEMPILPGNGFIIDETFMIENYDQQSNYLGFDYYFFTTQNTLVDYIEAGGQYKIGYSLKSDYQFSETIDTTDFVQVIEDGISYWVSDITLSSQYQQLIYSIPSPNSTFEISEKISGDLEIQNLFSSNAVNLNIWDIEVFNEEETKIVRSLSSNQTYKIGMKLNSNYLLDDSVNLDNYNIVDINGDKYYVLQSTTPTSSKEISIVDIEVSLLPQNNFEITKTWFESFEAPIGYEYTLINEFNEEISIPTIGKSYKFALTKSSDDFYYLDDRTNDSWSLLKISEKDYFVLNDVESSPYSEPIFIPNLDELPQNDFVIGPDSLIENYNAPEQFYYSFFSENDFSSIVTNFETNEKYKVGFAIDPSYQQDQIILDFDSNWTQILIGNDYYYIYNNLTSSPYQQKLQSLPIFGSDLKIIEEAGELIVSGINFSNTNQNGWSYSVFDNTKMQIATSIQENLDYYIGFYLNPSFEFEFDTDLNQFQLIEIDGVSYYVSSTPTRNVSKTTYLPEATSSSVPNHNFEINEDGLIKDYVAPSGFQYFLLDQDNNIASPTEIQVGSSYKFVLQPIESSFYIFDDIVLDGWREISILDSNYYLLVNVETSNYFDETEFPTKFPALDFEIRNLTSISNYDLSSDWNIALFDNQGIGFNLASSLVPNSRYYFGIRVSDQVQNKFSGELPTGWEEKITNNIKYYYNPRISSIFSSYLVNDIPNVLDTFSIRKENSAFEVDGVLYPNNSEAKWNYEIFDSGGTQIVDKLVKGNSYKIGFKLIPNNSLNSNVSYSGIFTRSEIDGETYYITISSTIATTKIVSLPTSSNNTLINNFSLNGDLTISNYATPDGFAYQILDQNNQKVTTPSIGQRYKFALYDINDSFYIFDDKVNDLWTLVNIDDEDFYIINNIESYTYEEFVELPQMRLEDNFIINSNDEIVDLNIEDYWSVAFFNENDFSQPVTTLIPGNKYNYAIYIESEYYVVDYEPILEFFWNSFVANGVLYYRNNNDPVSAQYQKTWNSIPDVNENSNIFENIDGALEISNVNYPENNSNGWDYQIFDISGTSIVNEIVDGQAYRIGFSLVDGNFLDQSVNLNPIIISGIEYYVPNFLVNNISKQVNLPLSTNSNLPSDGFTIDSSGEILGLQEFDGLEYVFLNSNNEEVTNINQAVEYKFGLKLKNNSFYELLIQDISGWTKITINSNDIYILDDVLSKNVITSIFLPSFVPSENFVVESLDKIQNYNVPLGWKLNFFLVPSGTPVSNLLMGQGYLFGLSVSDSLIYQFGGDSDNLPQNWEKYSGPTGEEFYIYNAYRSAIYSAFLGSVDGVPIVDGDSEIISTSSEILIDNINYVPGDEDKWEYIIISENTNIVTNIMRNEKYRIGFTFNANYLLNSTVDLSNYDFWIFYGDTYFVSKTIVTNVSVQIEVPPSSDINLPKNNFTINSQNQIDSLVLPAGFNYHFLNQNNEVQDIIQGGEKYRFALTKSEDSFYTMSSEIPTGWTEIEINGKTYFLLEGVESSTVSLAISLPTDSSLPPINFEISSANSIEKYQPPEGWSLFFVNVNELEKIVLDFEIGEEYYSAFKVSNSIIYNFDGNYDSRDFFPISIEDEMYYISRSRRSISYSFEIDSLPTVTTNFKIVEENGAINFPDLAFSSDEEKVWNTALFNLDYTGAQTIVEDQSYYIGLSLNSGYQLDDSIDLSGFSVEEINGIAYYVSSVQSNNLTKIISLPNQLGDSVPRNGFEINKNGEIADYIAPNGFRYVFLDQNNNEVSILTPSQIYKFGLVDIDDSFYVFDDQIQSGWTLINSDINYFVLDQVFSSQYIFEASLPTTLPGNNFNIESLNEIENLVYDQDTWNLVIFNENNYSSPVSTLTIGNRYQFALIISNENLYNFTSAASSDWITLTINSQTYYIYSNIVSSSYYATTFNMPTIDQNFSIDEIDENLIPSSITYDSSLWAYKIFNSDDLTIATKLINGSSYQIGFKLNNYYLLDSSASLNNFVEVTVENEIYYVSSIVTTNLTKQISLPEQGSRELPSDNFVVNINGVIEDYVAPQGFEYALIDQSNSVTTSLQSGLKYQFALKISSDQFYNFDQVILNGWNEMNIEQNRYFVLDGVESLQFVTKIGLPTDLAIDNFDPQLPIQIEGVDFGTGWSLNLFSESDLSTIVTNLEPNLRYLLAASISDQNTFEFDNVLLDGWIIFQIKDVRYYVYTLSTSAFYQQKLDSLPIVEFDYVIEEENGIVSATPIQYPFSDNAWNLFVFDQQGTTLVTNLNSDQSYRVGFSLNESYYLGSAIDLGNYDVRNIDGTTYYIYKNVANDVKSILSLVNFEIEDLPNNNYIISFEGAIENYTPPQGFDYVLLDQLDNLIDAVMPNQRYQFALKVIENGIYEFNQIIPQNWREVIIDGVSYYVFESILSEPIMSISIDLPIDLPSDEFEVLSETGIEDYSAPDNWTLVLFRKNKLNKVIEKLKEDKVYWVGFKITDPSQYSYSGEELSNDWTITIIDDVEYFIYKVDSVEYSD